MSADFLFVVLFPTCEFLRRHRSSETKSDSRKLGPSKSKEMNPLDLERRKVD